MVHQVGVVLQGGRFQAGKHAFGRAVLHGRLIHDLHGCPATLERFWMRTEYECVPRLDGHDAFEENRRRGICDRCDRKDDADRFGHFHQPAFRKLANDADGALVANVVVHEFGGHHVLHGLVFEDPQPGFLERQAGQVPRLFHARNDHRLDNTIYLVLLVCGKERGGGLGCLYESLEVCSALFRKILDVFFHVVLTWPARLHGPLSPTIMRVHRDDESWPTERIQTNRVAHNSGFRTRVPFYTKHSSNEPRCQS